MEKIKISLGYSHSVSSGPFRQLRRTRITEALRSLVRETELSVNGFIYPLFVVSSTKIRK